MNQVHTEWQYERIRYIAAAHAAPARKLQYNRTAGFRATATLATPGPRKVIVVTNLQPRKLRGVESNGMIVAAAAPPDGRPVLVGFHEDVPVGARLK